MKRRLFLAGTVALAAATHVRAQPRTGKVALVLGGGGCRGYGHIGVLRVLEKHGLKPDLVVGSSVGALVGAFYAAGKSAGEIENYGGKLNPNMLRGWILPKLGLFSGRGIRVAVLDTGLDLQHPDFVGRSITAQSFIPGQSVDDGLAAGL